MGTYMREKNYRPDLVKCSSARRTRETLEKMLPDLGFSPETLFSRSLYLAQPKALLDEIRQTSEVCLALLVVGHNPGIGALALALAALPEDENEELRKERLAENFPTACLAVLDFSASDWRGVKPLSGQLVDYVRPKELAAARDDLEGDDL
jgi:phosphohistidine phosphatase